MRQPDLVLTLLILAWPVWEHRVGLPRLQAALAQGRPDALTRSYRRTILLQWSLALLALLIWTLPGRPLADLGLRLPQGWRAGLTLALLGLLGAVLFRQERAVRRDPAAREKVRPQLAAVAWFLPRTRPELAGFTRLGLTAGVCEELLCRGWLFAVLAPWLPVGVTLLLTSLFFGLGHWYQGPAGVAKTGITGLVMGALYLATGSVLVPMVVHAAFDVGSGRVAFLVLGEPPV